jgi:hypothetical protein
MICNDNLSSSSSHEPPTDYILTALKEKLIHYINPSDLSSNIDIGRQKKENMIDSITHELLDDVLTNYFDLEEKVSSKYGSSFTDYLIGNINMTPVLTKKIMSTIIYPSTLTLTSSTYTMDSPSITENDYSITTAQILWKTILYPVGGNVSFSSTNILTPILTFSLKGSYIVNITIKWSDSKVTISQNISIDTDF